MHKSIRDGKTKGADSKTWKNEHWNGTCLCYVECLNLVHSHQQFTLYHLFTMICHKNTIIILQLFKFLKIHNYITNF